MTMNTDKEIYKNYISTHFGSFHNFDKETYSIYRLFKRNHLRYLPKNKDAKILDLGCGMGHFLYFLEKEGYNNYLGIDISPENIKFCKDKGFNVVQDDILEFLMENQKADVFILNDIIEHFSIDDAIKLFKMIHSNLNLGGKVIIKTTNGANPLLGNSSMYQDITHKFYFTQISLLQLLKVSGFNEVKIIPQDIYIFTYNPFNYLAKIISSLLNLVFKILFLLYGKKTITIFDKHLIAIAEK